MNKKLFSMAVPLLAFAAIAVMPAASQACTVGTPNTGCIPHWDRGAKRLAEGLKVKIMSWGAEVDLSQESGAGFIECKGIGGGTIENPKGTTGATGPKGPAGVGLSESDTYYECVEPKCETEIKAALGPAGYKGVGFASVENMPWKNQLEQLTRQTGGPGEFEETIGTTPNAGPQGGSPVGTPFWGSGFAEGPSDSADLGQSVQLPNGHGGNPAAAGGFGATWGAATPTGNAIGAVVGCEISPNPEGATLLGGTTGSPSRVAAEIPFEGELHPEIGGALNNNGAKTGEVKFNGAPSGELVDPIPAVGEGGKNKGQVRYSGYNGNPFEVIRVNEANNAATEAG